MFFPKHIRRRDLAQTVTPAGLHAKMLAIILLNNPAATPGTSE